MEKTKYYKFAFYFSNGTYHTKIRETNYFHTNVHSALEEAESYRPDKSYYSVSIWQIDSSFVESKNHIDYRG